MSLICQTFVQNSWKSDLCSNCFRSKDDHESSGKRNYSNGTYGSGSLSQRYVGVAGRSVYSRTYYGMNTWTSILERDSDYLKSPGLIKGMDNLIKENEKHQLRKDNQNEDKSEDYNSVNIATSKNLWLLSNYNPSFPSKRDSLQKEDSTDLGSDAGSHDTSASSSIDSASLEYESPSKIEPHMQEEDNSNMNEVSSNGPPLAIVHGIMRSCGHRTNAVRSISFNRDEEIIGYGGDVDYSDDDGSFIDDDDDLSVSSCDLTPDERLLRRVTEKNTDFNSENENLLESVTKSDNDCSEDSSSLRDDHRNRTGSRPENKVKLKRSQPHVTVKPNLKPQFPVTTEDVQSNKGVDALDMLLRGIKPKFVSKDEEMVENTTSNDCIEIKEQKRTTTKVTSIDDIIRDAWVSQVETNGDKQGEVQSKQSFDSLIKAGDINEISSETIQKPKRKVAPIAHKGQMTDTTINRAKTNINYSNNKIAQLTDAEMPSNNWIQKQKPNDNKTVFPQNLIQRRSSFMESQLGLEQPEVIEYKPNVIVHETRQAIHSVRSNILNQDIKNSPSETKENSKLAVKSSPIPETAQIFASTEKGILSLSNGENFTSTPKENRTCNKNNEKTTHSATVKKATDNFSTFGPKIQSQNGPQSSFLHSGFLKNSGKVCSTSEFLQEISSPSNAVVQTAGIQKSALHSSASIVKGMLPTKPFISLKSLNPKEKPIIPPKTGIKLNRGRPVSVPVITKPEVVNGEESRNKNTEVIYAVPALTPVCAISPTSSSSGYSTTSNVSLLSNKEGNDIIHENVGQPTSQKQPPVLDNKGPSDTPEHSPMYAKDTPDNSSQPNCLQPFKRAAPQPPFEDVPLNDYQPPPKIKILPHNEQTCLSPPSHLQVHLSDNQDFDSYSSFTDDFDDDDDDYPQSHSEESKPVNRSSSVTPSCRNTLGSIDNQQNTVSYKPADAGSGYTDEPVKHPATRSHSVPRSVESSVKTVRLDKKKSESSRFSFVKATFFRPSSPPSMKRKISFERSRDRAKKSSSGFSFKKLLRIGSSDKSKQKSQKDQEKQAEREMKKQQLQIVHPLDYNTTGVEVITRPETIATVYTSTPEMYSPSIPNSIMSTATNIINNVQKIEPKAIQSPNGDSFVQKQDLPVQSSFASIPQLDEEVPVHTRERDTSESVSSISVEKKSSFLKKKKQPERRNSAKLPPTGLPERSSSNIQVSKSKLGCNSEGRPKPPPPPRKTSLEASSDSSSHGEDRNSEMSSRHSSDSESSLRRQLPPRRLISSSSHGLKPSLYANLGDVRAPFTPRKPLRSSSIKDIEKEKRKAPLPPRHSSKSKLNDPKNGKGVAPSAPTTYYCSNGSHTTTDSSSDIEKASSQTSRTSSLPNLSDTKADVLAHSNFESLSNLMDEISSTHYSKEANPDLCSISSWRELELVTSDAIFCGPRVFYDGRAAGLKVVVMFSSENKIEIDPLVIPVPLHTFKEEVPVSLFGARRSGTNYIQASIWILPNMALSSLEEFSHFSQRVLERDPIKWEKRVCLLLLQLVTSLKHLQAKGIEETALDRILISNLAADEGDRNISSRLLLVSPSAGQSDHLREGISLCQCAAAVTLLLLGNNGVCGPAQNGAVLSPPFAPQPHAFVAFVATLREERASSLTKAKCILEAMLYGPTDFTPYTAHDSDEVTQNWLDNERMNLLVNIGKFNPRENHLQLVTKFQLFFLVRTSTKSLRESLLALEPPDVTSF